MDKKKLRRVEAVEVACLVQGGPAEVILFVFGTAGIEEELADLILLIVIHEQRGYAVTREAMRIMERYALRSIGKNIPFIVFSNPEHHVLGHERENSNCLA